jgi:ribosomal-protein-alanine N-acetyltransferase
MMAQTDINLRWCIRRDDKQILAIDDVGYVEPWSQADLLTALRNRDVIGIVAEDENRRVIGFCVYRLERETVRILRLAVEPRERRNGVATAMIERLKSKILTQRRSQIVVEVDGHQVFAQHMLSRCGFRAKCLPDDGIRFTYKE